MAKLSDAHLRGLKPRKKPYKVYDSDGVFMIVRPDGARWWRQRYRWKGKEQTLSLGVYPDIGLAEARARGAAMRQKVAQDVNPSAVRQEAKLAALTAAERTFKAIASEWLSQTAEALKWTPDHQERVRRRRETYFDPWIGRKDVREITQEEIGTCLQRISDRGLYDTARRARSEVHQVFRLAARKKPRLIEHNPVTELMGPDLLPKSKVRHHPAIEDPTEFGGLLRAIEAYHGSFVVKQALRLLPRVFVRPGELRHARWSEIDFKAAEWRIPAERMKMREQHIVPLSRQAIAILNELEPLTGPDGYIFPQPRDPDRPISENTLNVALQACGYDRGQASPHGFRTSASTMLNEKGFNADWIERQLAHGPRDKVRGAYNRAQYLQGRREMMQIWSDHIDLLRSGNIAIALKPIIPTERVAPR
jgi:integrase